MVLITKVIGFHHQLTHAFQRLTAATRLSRTQPSLVVLSQIGNLDDSLCHFGTAVETSDIGNAQALFSCVIDEEMNIGIESRKTPSRAKNRFSERVRPKCSPQGEQLRKG
jgi:hypothetical protein